MFAAKVNATGLLEVLGDFDRAYYPYLRKAYARSMGAFAREFKSSLSGGKKLEKPGKFARGKMSFRYEILPKATRGGRLRDISASVYTMHPAGPDLEHGATKRSKRSGGKLAIPFGYARTAKGNVKQRFRSAKQVAKERQTRLFFRNDEPFLAVRIRGRNSQGRPKWRRVFRLVERVKIEPKLRFFADWDKFKPEVEKREREEHRRFLREVIGVRA
jgi:hypothetical protein